MVEWDRDEVYSVIMNYEGLYNAAMRFAEDSKSRSSRSIRARTNLMNLAVEVAQGMTPRIRLSRKSAGIIADRILEDYK